MKTLHIVITCLLLTLCLSISAQTKPDAALLAEINRIKAIDNHAHALPFVAEGDTNPDYAVMDAFPPEIIIPVRLRTNNPEFLGAWRYLYGYRHNDFADAHVRELLAAKQRVKSEKGEAYPAWVLDKLGVDTMFVDRTPMGPGLIVPRFRWVWRADELLFPLNNEEVKQANPQRERDFNHYERRFKELLTEIRLTKLPDTLDDYVSRLIIPSLEKRKQQGAPAIKFTLAYVRSLNFDDVTEKEASRVYAKYIDGGEATPADYKILQDYLFRRIALESGRIGLIVHIHVGAGEGGWFHNSTAGPFLLDSVVNDPKLKGTKFVLIHGGLPFAQATRFLLDKDNVYADFSSQGFLTSDRELSGVIRSWLEFMPEKVLFGTDSYPMTKAIGWEEIGWLTNRSSRNALAIALTGMMSDGQITRARASELARMVMRDNAAKLYGIIETRQQVRTK